MLTVDWTTTPPEQMKPCPACGGSPTVLTDFVLDDGDPVAQVLITLDPHAPVAEVLLSLSVTCPRHGEETTHFMLRMQRMQDTIGSGFTDPDDQELGVLSREQALEHPNKDAVFRMLDLVSDADPRLRDHFFNKSWARH